MEQEERERAERKVKKAAQLLLFRRHRTPGVKAWELKKALGDDYMEIIEILNSILLKLGMEVRRISEGSDNERFVVVLKDLLTDKASGLRIDDVAILSASLAYIIAKQGKASRKSVEDFLAEKFPRRRVIRALERYIVQGYLREDENLLYIGWRTRVEVDSKTLMDLILTS
ncbi:MAG: hypothetical protein J7I99_02130 [Methanophagales archaeon]|nr:hypothetical protein [Methanophagales archaeon]